MRSPIAWYGGKSTMAHHIVPLLPAHRHYCEPYAGGLAVLFAKQPATIETINDLEGGLINFYRVVRDPALFPALQRRLELTPYARAEMRAGAAGCWDHPDPVERAALWFSFVRQSVAGHASNRAKGSWSYCVTDAARSISASVSKWMGAIDGLQAAHERLRTVQIEQDDAPSVIARFDSPDTLFFLDPPYHPATRSDRRYAHDLTAADHEALVAAAQGLSGMALLCGHDHASYAPLEAAGWEKLTWDVRVRAHVIRTGSSSTWRKECIWRNPAAQLRHPQQQLEVVS